MASKIITVVVLCGMLWLLVAFGLFTAFLYLTREDVPERIFFVAVSVFSFIISLIISYAIMTS